MSKNENLNLLLITNDNKNKTVNIKLLEAEQRLMNEGIIFKRRIFSHKKDIKNENQKRANSKKSLSIKLTDEYIYKKENNKENRQNNANIPISSFHSNKSSFIYNSHSSINDFLKYETKKTNNKKLNTTSNPYNCKSPNYNSNKNILKHNSRKKFHNKQEKSFTNIFFKDKENNLLKNCTFSPRVSTNNIKLENGYLSPVERSKYYINTYRSRDNRDSRYNRYEEQRFNYKKWNKITINNIFDKEKDNYDVKENNCKEKNDKMYGKSDIIINENGIQEIVIQNIKKERKTKVNEIPCNRKKNKNNNIMIGNYLDKKNILNYCKQMSNLALAKEYKNNFTTETVSGLKFDQIIRSPEIKRNIKINKTNSLKKYKSSNKKSDSMERIISDNNYSRKDSFSEIKNQKTSSKNKSSSKKPYNNVINSNKKEDNKYNLEEQNIYRNDYNLKTNSNSELTTQIIKIKNHKLLDFIKNNDTNSINNTKNKEIITKNKDEDIIKEEYIDIKNNLYDHLNEENFNTNTDLLTEKEKGYNNYTFDNKYEIDTEQSFKILNNYNNNIFDNASVKSKVKQNNIGEAPYSLKYNIFSRKIIGGINIKNNHLNNGFFLNEKKTKSKINNKHDKGKENTSNNNFGDDYKNNQFNGDYVELAKICANQEKIISDLVKNVQQLNNQICDKDLCINELNNQLYSIKYDLLNTLQKTNIK